MKRDSVAKLTIVSIILSPFCGGLVGRLTAEIDICGFPNVYLDSILCYFGIISWIIASLVFYTHYKDRPIADI